ncbi:hypothetical protein [Cupriavidus pinatubonensis]|uniref:hypothetical protein n=1 Tax=Cupriavidus pinatubonensis TaxID=248026 RepID=UPI003614F00F
MGDAHAIRYTTYREPGIAVFLKDLARGIDDLPNALFPIAPCGRPYGRLGSLRMIAGSLLDRAISHVEATWHIQDFFKL